MENELISNKVENKIIADLKGLIESKKQGKIMLSDYLDIKSTGACNDFASVYEASDKLHYFIKQQREKGIAIEVRENDISVG
ncbi:MAG: hypothetical protein LBR52_03385 [Prevotellaceae bacterium]|jgi:hypothetical protein|nr:hypothetical protein [Prevotellaceae bacterium]